MRDGRRADYQAPLADCAQHCTLYLVADSHDTRKDNTTMTPEYILKA